jgi:hypothetical protein
MIELAREEARKCIETGIESFPALNSALQKLELDTATEFIEKS